ncbi:MAG: hypothetical protein UR23_C0006G0011 [Candidatus Roizmanbacteria bacterium GW2011_GWA2_32_13]|uniref:Uncharacterized protein n=1 Tax=Candidatus Roizmanbacteria bacterium GW2011_GWA2_32_13 TaxID=1618475 RepID=A0A0F9Z0E2_9BACT|nr:MAG: hypothetical protein UR23_C0006G0011 [Candidatus Roizmanbacteria bacterium GW2011_GWA2_32_13]
MFKLPNGKKINEEALINAMEKKNIKFSYFLNTKTGKVKKERSEKPNDKYLVKIPRISDRLFYDWMKEYTDEFINREDPGFAKKVYNLLENNIQIKKIINLLKSLKEGWIHGWDQWKSDNLYQFMQDWLDGLSLNITEEFEGFDDCPICQKMMLAEKAGINLSKEELKEVFAQAKESELTINKITKHRDILVN